MITCKEEMQYERYSGAWIVQKVEQAWYPDTDSNVPDSVKTFDSDTLGYFNFYHTSLYGTAYILLNFPSLFLVNDFDTDYEIHPSNDEILTFMQIIGINEVYTTYSIKGGKSNRQQWTTFKGYKNGFVRETIWVKKHY